MIPEKLTPEDIHRRSPKARHSTIGFIGLAECLKALIGKHHGESEEAEKLGLEIVAYMRKRMDEEARKRDSTGR